jgi:hypothetical protein
MYKSEISNTKWLIYAILADVGWLSFFVALLMCFIKTPEILESGAVVTLLVIDILSAALMLCGIVELMGEHRKKLDRVLSGKQLFQEASCFAKPFALYQSCSPKPFSKPRRPCIFKASGVFCFLHIGDLFVGALKTIFIEIVILVLVQLNFLLSEPGSFPDGGVEAGEGGEG